VAFEPPSAGFIIDWQALAQMRAKAVGFVTITHAAGISSTGNAELDLRLPFDEPYHIPEATVVALQRVRANGGRIVAVGTTVVRALEHAGRRGLIRPGEGLATQRIGSRTQLRVVDAILTGTHEPGSSHYELLRAFADDATLRRVTRELDSCGYRTHEFGDSVLIERMPREPTEVRPQAGAASFQIKEIVKPSRKGQTAEWPAQIGTVSRVTSESVFVQWHDCAVEDEMNFDEVVSAGTFADNVPTILAELPRPKYKPPTIH
jgi:S-adenosylmethionine:tRNA ribosyltransferase-isomerase